MGQELDRDFENGFPSGEDGVAELQRVPVDNGPYHRGTEAPSRACYHYGGMNSDWVKLLVAVGAICASLWLGTRSTNARLDDMNEHFNARIDDTNARIDNVQADIRELRTLIIGIKHPDASGD